MTTMNIATMKGRTRGVKAMPGSRDRRPQRSGMTLIEIMIVLVILVSVMGFAVGAFMGQRARANRQTTYIYIRTLADAVNAYDYAVGQPPTTEQGLEALLVAPSDLRNPGAWSGPYLEAHATIRDVWGSDYQYRSPGENGRRFDIFSLGPDGIAGTDDDIGSWMSDSDFR